MRKETGESKKVAAWKRLNSELSDLTPQLASVLGDEAEFISLYVKVKADGTMLGVLKRYGSDGGPMVCFGSGYTVAGVFLGLEGSIAANKWRPDKPWQPDKK